MCCELESRILLRRKWVFKITNIVVSAVKVEIFDFCVLHFESIPLTLIRCYESAKKILSLYFLQSPVKNSDKIKPSLE